MGILSCVRVAALPWLFGMALATGAAGQEAAPAARDPAALFREAKQAMQDGQLEVAERDFRRVIALDPRSAPAHTNLGVVLMRQKRWSEARMELQRAQTLTPAEPGIALNLGLVSYRSNDFAGAIGPFQTALRLAPESKQARYLLGLCYFFTNRYREAAEMLAPLWESESQHLSYLYVVSIAAAKAPNPELEKRAFDQMLKVGRNSPEFHLYLGKAWLAKDDTAKALLEFRAAEAAQPNLPLVHYFLGRTYLERHDYSQAEAELRRDAALEPDFAYNYEDLGRLYAELNQPDKAAQWYRRAVEQNGTLVNSWFGLAKLARDAGRYDEALEMLDRAEPLAPQSASLHYTKGQVLTHLGQKEKAQEEFATSAKLLKSFNDRLQQPGDEAADAQQAAQQ